MYPNVSIKHESRVFLMEGYDERDHIFNEWSNTQTFYEIPLLKKIQAMALEGCYVDAGANQGNHTIFFSGFCPSSEIVAVEASMDIAKLLKRNIANHVTTPCTLYEACLYSSDGLQAISPKGISPANCGSTSFVVSYNEKGESPTLMLDSVLTGKDVALIKIDVEGMERDVLIGTEKTITRCRPAIFAEALSGQAKDSLDSFLNSFGYRHQWTYYRTHLWTHQND